ncbi:hypothetical protein GCM10022199_23780 [Marihabitans asiaticum]|uniref:Copper(I)-binding protein n=1 Tax=Marihabitans asiaticum TaxID=415218 RepID=A0A560W9V1_9MICO|nr:copper chaperone PCu(A)C [Marihabitans asiaticum]TWD14401.1 hypothetical protein FB557_1810 [Marihabitans asiaticum]
MRATRITLATLGAVSAAALLAGCGGEDASTTASATDPTTSSSSAEQATSPLTISDGWVKATDEGMTGAFGTLRNSGEQDIVITGGSSDIAGMVEAHVMTTDDSGQMVMTEAKDGHTVPAGGELVLEPGGPHLMLMQLEEPVVAGTDYVITVTTKGGESVDLTVAGREFSGAEEDYDGGEDDHSDDEHEHEHSEESSS